MIVRTYDGLQAITTPTAPSWAGSSGGHVHLYGSVQSYASIYRTDPNIRTPVDFFAFNLAHLGLHVFRRVSDTDRIRLVDHELAQWIAHPNPWTTRYRAFEQLGQDLGIYSNAYWLKVRLDGRIGLMRLPPESMLVDGALRPSAFVWTSPTTGRRKEFAPSEIVFFRWSTGADPDRPQMGLSRLETLRRILAEQAAAGDYRQSLWGNAARMDGIIEQAKDAPNWTPDQQHDFREQWNEFAAGGAKVGKTAVLPKGMTWKEASFSAKDAEFIIARKQAREECAASALIPQPFVGILDHATFSNIREQHKHLYQDTLGPPLEMIQEEIEASLLPECTDQADIYVEFNIAAKLKGTFEEQASAIQLSTGRPWRTVNEARALENLPRIDDAELDRVAPQQGGPSDATARPGAPTAPTPFRRAGEDDAADDADALIVAPIVSTLQLRLRARLAKLTAPERALAFDPDRWRRELVTNLTPLVGADRAATVAARVVCAEQQRLSKDAA